MRLPAFLLAFVLAACASQEEKHRAYNPIVGGTQTIHLTGYTQEFKTTAPPFYQLPVTQAMSPVEGGKCTLRNDKGTWEADLPGEVVVTTGGVLHIECHRDGFKRQTVTVGCSSPKTRGAVAGAFGPLLMSPQLTAYGLVFAPAAVLGVMVAGSIIGSEASAAAAGPEGRESCDYDRTAVGIYLWPEERFEEPW